MGSRSEIAVWLGLIILSLPARFFLLNDSLWLDEGGVANSILAPSLGQMLNYENWLQTSPPLFLVLMRAASWLAGSSEPVLRIVPLAEGPGGPYSLLVATRPGILDPRNWRPA